MNEFRVDMNKRQIRDNTVRIDMYQKMLEIAEQYGDQYEQERIHRNITEWVEDTRDLQAKAAKS